MEVVAKQKQEKITDMKKRMREIYLAVSWREVSRTYFDKSVSWFQQKMYGNFIVHWMISLTAYVALQTILKLRLMRRLIEH